MMSGTLSKCLPMFAGRAGSCFQVRSPEFERQLIVKYVELVLDGLKTRRDSPTTRRDNTDVRYPSGDQVCLKKSYDTSDQGRPNGAFSIRKLRPGSSVSRLYIGRHLEP